MFAYRPETVLGVLDRLGKDHGDELPEDYGQSLLPTLVADYQAYQFPAPGYWQDVGTVDAYWTAHQRLVCEGEPHLDDADWPILTLAPQRPPARLETTADLDTALVSPGCKVAGRVIRSVLGPGVVVGEGATVRDSVLFEDCVIEPGAVVDTAILDFQARVEEGGRVGEQGAGPNGVVLVGEGVSVRRGQSFLAGARVTQ